MGRAKKEEITILTLEEEIDKKTTLIEKKKKEIKNIQAEIKILNQKKALLVLEKLEKKAEQDGKSVSGIIDEITNKSDKSKELAQ